MKQTQPVACSLTNYCSQFNIQSLNPLSLLVLTVEQLLRLGVALPGGGFCGTVNGAGVWPDGGGTGLWLSLAQDGGPGGGIAVADTWVYPVGCWGSSN